jgi:DNA primase
MRRLSDQEITDIRSKADIGDVISQYLPLTRRGRNLWAVCPFHDDHDPSLSISKDKQIYKCFVCGAGGNVFTFVQNIEKISFLEAVVKIAKGVGINIDDALAPAANIDPRKQALSHVLKESINYFRYQLNASDGIMIKDYLLKRGIGESLIDKFEVGYNPQDDQCSKFLIAKGYPPADIVAVNVARVNGKNFSDVFTNRIVFPIHDEQGSPLGFTARSVLADESAKYINTTETELYTKGLIIYNYHRALPEVKKAEFVIVTEGVTDVIAFYRANIRNVVATLGTAATPEQVRKLRQMHWHIVIGYDGDNAGQKAAFRLGDMLIKANCTVEVLDYKVAMDPDDIINTYGEQHLISIVENRIPWMDFLLDYSQSLYQLDNYNQKKQYVLAMGAQIKNLRDDLDRKHFTERLAAISGYKFEDLWSIVSQNVKSPKPFEPVADGKPKVDCSKAECEICAQMMISKDAAIRFRDELGYLSSPIANRCAILIIDTYRTQNEIVLADLLTKANDPILHDFILWLSDWPLFPKEASPASLTDAMTKVRIDVYEAKIKKYKQESAQLIDANKKAEIANKIIDAQREITALKRGKKED